MIREINLQKDRFLNEKISDLGRKNFIYGKNGTGKSSIAKAILEQYSDEYEIRIFQGFSSVIAENGELNAISLGRENTALQPQIDEQSKKYEQLRADVTKNEENVDNTYARYEEAQEALDQFKKTIEQLQFNSSVTTSHGQVAITIKDILRQTLNLHVL
ncbi:AAA family ATPase [Staphylococcus delphini]|uniref:AAA family ATPase n=1 Tax=Staphylococcus delphini TaxID=53344 RepID=UPI0012D2CDB9|nr:AAA family ATPase [Staphylococcus delphini]MTV19274.1 AAA family ATPase [Staphylococcus delphini]